AAAAGHDDQEPVSQLADVCGDPRARALTDGHQGDHRADTDDDAEHRQKRAHGAPPDLPERHQERAQHHGVLAPGEGRREIGRTRSTSDGVPWSTILPSLNTTTRETNSDMSGSWVTIAMVMPRSWFNRSSTSMISTLRALSRLPVGSSATSSDGSVTSARAMATRCCCPPESSDGAWSARSDKPTA